MSDPNPRLQAVAILAKVFDKRLTLDQAAPAEMPPLVRELVYGTLRYNFSLGRRVDEILTRKLRTKDNDIRYLLLVGAYQMLHTRIPDHAAVGETVACTRLMKKPWAAALVNAVLRNLPKPTEEWEPAAVFDHPHWYINLTRTSLPDHWADVLATNNSRAPLTLRVNLARCSVDTYRSHLDAANIQLATPMSACGTVSACGTGVENPPETLTLQRPLPQLRLPGYSEGLVSVQDSAAQLAATLVPLPSGARVLDACAAPGGKGFHLLERNPGLRLRMQDNAQPRLAVLRAEAQRLGHRCEIEAADSTELSWWDGEAFALVLLDAPCSGSGTLRRHPDIKVLRTPTDIDALEILQQRLLDNLWVTLAPGGSLIYCTCSLFRCENDAIIEAFLGKHPDASSQPLNLQQGVQMTHGWQTLPTRGGGDGFYYAILQKAES